MISIEQNYQVTDGDFHRFKSSVFFRIILSVNLSLCFLILFFFLLNPLLFHISLRSHVLLSSYIYFSSYIFSFPNFSEFLFLLIQFEKQLFSFVPFLFSFSIYSPLILIKIFVAHLRVHSPNLDVPIFPHLCRKH